MADPHDTLGEVSDGQPLLPVMPLLQLNVPLVEAVHDTPVHDTSDHDTVLRSDEAGPVTAPVGTSIDLDIDLDVDRHLHGAPELLAPAELRRAALLRLIGLGRFASRPQPN